jgi:hypothetical protein
MIKTVQLQGVELLGLLLAGSTGQHMRQVEMGWPDIHWLARDQGGLAGGSPFDGAWHEFQFAVGA